MNLETGIDRDLWHAVRRSYESQAWSNAILDAVHFLSDAVRLKSGLQSDGTALAGQALGGKEPKLRLNRLQTESDRNIQAGAEQLLRGLYQAIRNPRSHERSEDSQRDADALIYFIDYFCRLIGHARAAFTVNDFVEKVIDPHFVPNERYAALLVAEIPVRYRCDVAIAVYHRKVDGDGRKLRYFFNALFSLFNQNERKDLFEVISAELRKSNSEADLRLLLQLLRPVDWQSIDETARLRTENRLIRNIQEGRYLVQKDKCLAGALGTWSASFWQHFTLKTNLIQTIKAKLSSEDVSSQDYALKYCFPYMEQLCDRPPWDIEALIIERLKAGDVRFKDALEGLNIFGSEWDNKWSPEYTDAYNSFVAVSMPALDLDDIPF